MKLTTSRLVAFNWIYMFLGMLGLFVYPQWSIVLFWFIFAIGNGTVGHRYFAHGNFTVNPATHWILAVWCTISAYSPPSYWQTQHRHHHRHTDTEQDIHSPVNGFLMALGGWPFSVKRIDSIFEDRASVINYARSQRDPAIRFTKEYFFLINLVFMVSLYLVDPLLPLSAAAAVMIEHARLGLINTVCHIKFFPGNYRNHDTKDKSYNNLFIGLFGLGFGWHNNHHRDASKLVLTERWWELDVEGLVGKLLSKF